MIFGGDLSHLFMQVFEAQVPNHVYGFDWWLLLGHVRLAYHRVIIRISYSLQGLMEGGR